MVGINIALATYKRHETSLKFFQEFLAYKYHSKDVPVNEVDLDMLLKYHVHSKWKCKICGENNNMKNTAGLPNGWGA